MGKMAPSSRVGPPMSANGVAHLYFGVPACKAGIFQGNYSFISEETTWAVCEGSVFGRDAKAKPTGRYLRRLPEQIAHVG